jgi:cyclohexanone monooxygenase
MPSRSGRLARRRSLNRDDVTLVDLRRSPITEVVPDGITTTDGTIEVDVIGFATGFDAMTARSSASPSPDATA